MNPVNYRAEFDAQARVFPKFCCMCKQHSRRVFKIVVRQTDTLYICSAKCLEVFHNRLSPQRHFPG